MSKNPVVAILLTLLTVALWTAFIWRTVVSSRHPESRPAAERVLLLAGEKSDRLFKPLSATIPDPFWPKVGASPQGVAETGQLKSLIGLKPSVRLKGIVRDESASRALVLFLTNDSTEMMSPGEIKNGVVLQSVEADHIIVREKNARFGIWLDYWQVLPP